MKCKCSQEIPPARVQLGYRVCVSCSEEQPIACIPITNHKTGNTIQTCSKELAAHVARATRRPGFGAMAGMRAGSEPKRKVKLIHRAMPARARQATAEEREQIGSECIAIVEEFGIDAMHAHLQRLTNSALLSLQQAREIRVICEAWLKNLSKD